MRPNSGALGPHRGPSQIQVFVIPFVNLCELRHIEL